MRVRDTQFLKKSSGVKASRVGAARGREAYLLDIPKLEEANHAGTKHSGETTLLITEGDSAKALAVGGLGVVGRDNFGVFPLRVGEVRKDEA